MKSEHILQLIQDLPKFREIRESLRESGGAVQVEGLAAATKSAFTAALQRTMKRPTLVVTYNYEQAEHLYDDLSSLGMNGEALLVAPSDGMVYRDGDTDYDVIGRRITALSRLQDGRPVVIVAPISAVLQRTIPPEVLAAHRIRVEKNAELDLDEAGHTLVELGYERALMVERQGEFSIRGGILDVFPSTEESPVRIELFGDEVESIRWFDPESQRSSAHTDAIDIGPAREILLSPELAESGAKALADLLELEWERFEAEDDHDASVRLRAAIEDDIARLQNRAYFDGVEYYLPLLYKQEHCLLDYLPADAVVILDEPHQIKSHWDQLHEELLEALHARISRGDVIALPVSLSVDFSHFTERMKHRQRTVLLSLLDRSVEWIDIARHIPLPSAPMDSFGGQIEALIDQIKTWTANGCRVVLVSSQPHRVVEVLTEHGLSTSPIESLGGRSTTPGIVEGGRSTTPAPTTGGSGRSCTPVPGGIYVIEGTIRSGFKLPEAGLMVAGDGEMFGQNRMHRPRKAFRKGLAISSLLELNEGDYVVHINHGIGRYRGMTKLTGPGGERDYLLVEYAGTDKLYVPTDQIDRIQKYIGSDAQQPTVHRLGGTEWARTTKRVKASVREMANELIQLYAARQALDGYSFSPDTPWQQELESAFQYDETPDQLTAIEEVKSDLEAPRPMDRLICGDVGFGKTEVAIRAVFKVVNDGKQAAILAPTTVLAQQHYNTFTERLAAYPVNVAMLSRFRSKAEQKKTVDGLKTGEVDIVIGTHRLLSKDIEFRDLGLLVVDEEQRFGVTHKERLKQMKRTVDVLTLTATPIPRTLHMSLSGIRDMSVINNAPEGRMPIKTYCRESDDELIRDAILRELDRDGQIYFVHNRVENIEHIADHLRKLVPYARIRVGHGQMSEDELEQVMLDFYEHQFDVLVCTTIIESGLDIPNVNTIIVNDSDRMGLAQLYQLRGRVGRSDRQAYAYLLFKANRMMTDIAEKRLQAIKEFSELGSGFKIAIRDLEIRGAGNLLGAEQHGQMSSVGFDMYCQLLAEAVREVKGEEPDTFELPPADLSMDAHIPSSYIDSESVRMTFYKKMTSVREPKDVDQLEEELRDRFGDLPSPVSNSLDLLRLRLRAFEVGVGSIVTEHRQVIVRFAGGIRLDSDVCVLMRRKIAGTVFMPDRMIVDGASPDLFGLLNQVMDALPDAIKESRDLRRYLKKIRAGEVIKG